MEQSETNEQICSDDDILKLLTHLVKTNHRVKNADIKGETIMELCVLLFSKDYKFTIVPNLNGELCSHYPMKLVISEYENGGQLYDEHVESRYDQQQIFQMMKNARCARCWSRFVIPVIFYEGKHICRSATLSGAAEMFGRSTTDYFMSNQNTTSSAAQGNPDFGKPDMFDKFRGHDIQLLKYFDVGFICDLMVEKKKTKFGLPLTSSEKVDKENRYSDFSILGMPYPGCEFFKEWKDNFYCGDKTIYDWGQALNNSSLDLPSTPFVQDMGINWDMYKEWSIVELTQNYLKLLLKYIKEASTGILIHCISGWDRTPLFISLLRLSLWADGLIHTSLNPTEMLYLTLGYDWYLFGHNLPDRLSNDEEVLFFCFKVLKDITSEAFSLAPRPQNITQAGASQHLRQSQAQQQPQHMRVDSDSNLGIQGILLADELMSFPNKGSTNSLNSLGSSEGPTEPIHFRIGDIREEEEEGGGGERVKSKSTSIAQRRSMSTSQPLASPVLRHSSPITAATRRRRRSSEGQALSIQSNHFMASPAGRASSPMGVPGQRSEAPLASHQSVGSWQIISSTDNLRAMDSSHSHSNSSTDKSGSVHESSLASELSMNSLRCQRLDSVSRLFQSAYIRAVPSSHTRSSSVGAGLTSLFDRFVEQVGLKGGGGGPNQGSSSRRGV